MPTRTSSPRIVLFATGSPLAAEYVESLRRLGWTLAGAVANRDGPAYAAPLRPASAPLFTLPCLCPLFTPAHRATAVAEAAAAGFGFPLALIDPTAILAADTTVGGGSFVNAGVVIGAAARLGRHVVVNRAASIGHHTEVTDFASIGPGVTIAGSARIGTGALVGAGAVILPGISVGAFARVAAGAVVARDVPPRTCAAGNPARHAAGQAADFALPDA